MPANEITLPTASDFHIHLRQDAMMRMVVPRVAEGGVSLAYVMPNLRPPITSTEQALTYKAHLEKLAPNVTFLMTLFLSPDLTPDEVRRAKQAGIVGGIIFMATLRPLARPHHVPLSPFPGVKSYPRGVTTNSDSGIESYEIYYPVFKVMEEEGLVLNLHGEIPSDDEKVCKSNLHETWQTSPNCDSISGIPFSLLHQDVCFMNAEEKFLPHLAQLHADFPKLKIVLEHATSKAAVDMVKSLGDTVACTITVHHLELIVDDWAGQAHHFCKPVAKYPHDRKALRDVVAEGHSRFFLGTDSAPHPHTAKETAHAHAGVFTTPLVLPYLATILDSFGALDRLQGFACEFGKRFYGVVEKDGHGGRTVTLKRTSFAVPQTYNFEADVVVGTEAGGVVPFWAGKEVGWRIVKG
ncbi:dihydroorotase, homodimeric type [Jimgerdemannia flammicorona]|uniref:Dihydroorotase, homodimeric type n=1 Tax=Jimgerdemannia flammicorona TaxID=994334 RepID=A0A433QD00_9FUNG|nr:dihydroorotase, homodimeric type [Jimgerdemannia flammicorona]